jgi:4-aminobutyrate aminotransferase-like enzyme
VISPPLIIDKNQCDQLIDVIDTALTQVSPILEKNKT